MKTEELIERIQALYSKGVPSDDSRLSDQHIYHKLLTVRSKLIYQQLRKSKLSELNFNTIDCIELIDVDESSCPCLPTIGCKVKRTKYPLPTTISLGDTPLIDTVFSSFARDEKGALVRYTEKTRASYEAGKHNKYTAKSNFYVIENNFAFVYGTNVGNAIKVRLLLDDPSKAYSYPTLCSSDSLAADNCLSIYDLPFSIDSFLIEDLIEIAKAELIDDFRKSKEDVSNDSQDTDTIQETR